MVDDVLKERYPTIYEFLDTSFWLKCDGANLIEVLHRFVTHAHAERAQRYGQELKSMSQDEDLSNEELADIFGREGNHPYLIVGRDNAKDMLFCLGEFLDYILQNQRAP